ncbi:glycosyltransferase [Pseudonocardia nematodicida]|uniref:Glycosyltransferase n=1 Tax=Pseudonocardia nematodicida TaxID=1206997 RepID=A0ABV1KFP9_9PSEU
MRIAIVRTPDVPDPGPGVGAALAQAGHRVLDLVAESGPGGSPDLTAAWAGDPPDVVHAVGAPAARAAVGAGVPVVVVLAPGAADHELPVGVARVLVAGEDQHTAALGHGIRRSLLRVVPACVDTDAFAPDGPALRRGGSTRLVVHGSLARGGGAAAAVRALSRIRGAELLLAGGSTGADPDRDRLFAAARELGVADRVRFLGPVPDDLLPRLLRSADVVVAAPDHDVPATPVLQAMACARPVVASAVGGLRDAVVDRVTGVQVRPGRPAELALALREVLADDALRTGYGVAGRDRAVSRFDRSRIAEALSGLYAEVAGYPAGEPDGPGPDDRAPAGVVG